MELSAVYKCMEELREVVNSRDVLEELTKDQRKRQQLWASMDVIEDTDAAIAAYQRLQDVRDEGCLYLIVYGILQVLFVQQDAIRHTAEAVGFDYECPPELHQIREIRNCAIGHPTKRERKDRESFGIIRGSLSHEGFTLYRFDYEHDMPSVDVNLPKLIDEQICQTCKAIVGIVGHLRQAYGQL